jgi:hypothetical protein
MNKQELQIRKLLKEFIKEIDINMTIKKDKEFYASILEKQLGIAYNHFINPPNSENRLHRKVLREMGIDFDITTTLYYLLHEIGHIQSAKRYGQDIYNRIENYLNENEKLTQIENDLEQLRLYKKITLERDADDYAYKFYLNNKKRLKKLDRELREIRKQTP